MRLALLALVIFASCGEPQQEPRYSSNSYKLDFDPMLWAYNPTVDQKKLWETREFMMDDLLNHHLFMGMERVQITAILGPPLIEKGISYTWHPAPLDTFRPAYRLYGDSLRIFAVYRNDPRIPVLRYNVGSSNDGPNMLHLVLDRNDKLADVLTTIAIPKK